MKKTLLLAATAMFLLANACKKNEPASISDSNESLAMMKYLADTYGFAPESIVDHDDCFVAEGDQCFHKENFWEHYGKSSENEFLVGAAQTGEGASDRRHYRYAYLVTNSKNVVITVLPNVTTSWRNAITKAVSDWNAINGGLTFSVQYKTVSQWGTVNVSMKSSLPKDTYAEAYYPTGNGYPGTNLYINPYFTDLLSHNSKVGVIAHEIGHTVGIRHTDSGQGTLINNVSTSCKNNPDPNSVMSASGDFYYGFTTCDKEAVKALYLK